MMMDTGISIRLQLPGVAVESFCELCRIRACSVLLAVLAWLIWVGGRVTRPRMIWRPSSSAPPPPKRE